MTQERFRKIEELYQAIRQASAGERAALLSLADPDVRREVESLLAEGIDGYFIERPAIECPATDRELKRSRIHGRHRPGALPYREQTWRGRHGAGLPCGRHAIGPVRGDQDHS